MHIFGNPYGEKFHVASRYGVIYCTCLTINMAVTVDEVLNEIGGYGKYQILMLQMVGFIEFGLASFNVMIITFIAGEPTWECVSNSTVCNITGIVDTTSDDYKVRCDMPRSEWKFSDTFTSTVTEVSKLIDLYKDLYRDRSERNTHSISSTSEIFGYGKNLQ